MNVIKLFSISQGMSSIRRYSGVHLIKEESVMEHTGFVCLFTYFICEKLNHECEPEHLINTGLALEKSVVHDMDEVITGDIPRPTKYFNSETKKVFDKMAKIGMTQVVNQLELQNINTFLNWEKAKDGKEGKIVGSVMTYKQKYTQKFINQVHSLRDKMSQKEIAEKFNASARTIRYILKERQPTKENNLWSKIKKIFRKE
jgi:5'-deoxynucleotidase YfbR-like HD superfamily hydrolase